MDSEDELLARHFGARATKAWRAFLRRHRALVERQAEPKSSTQASAAPGPALRIGEPSQVGEPAWLLFWPTALEWLLARPRDGRAEMLGRFVPRSASAWSGLLEGHRLATFGRPAIGRLRAELAALDPAAPELEITDLQELAAGPDRRRRFARRPTLLAARLGLRYLEQPGMEELQALAALLQHLQQDQSAGLALGRRAATEPILPPWSFQSGAARLRALEPALPASPGVYLLLDAAGRVYYVGSSANLRRRVLSYLRARPPYAPRLRSLLEPLADLQIHPCGTELSALLEEDRLIRSWRPRGNQVRRVHPRGRPIRDQIVLLPHAGGGLELTALRSSCAPLRLRIRRSDLAAAARRLQRFYLRRPPVRLRGAGRREAELVQSWLRRRGDRVARLPASSATRAADWRRLLLDVLEDQAVRCGPVVHQGRPFDRPGRLD